MRGPRILFCIFDVSRPSRCCGLRLRPDERWADAGAGRSGRVFRRRQGRANASGKGEDSFRIAEHGRCASRSRSAELGPSSSHHRYANSRSESANTQRFQSFAFWCRPDRGRTLTESRKAHPAAHSWLTRTTSPTTLRSCPRSSRSQWSPSNSGQVAAAAARSAVITRCQSLLREHRRWSAHPIANHRSLRLD